MFRPGHSLRVWHRKVSTPATRIFAQARNSLLSRARKSFRIVFAHCDSDPPGQGAHVPPATVGPLADRCSRPARGWDGSGNLNVTVTDRRCVGHRHGDSSQEETDGFAAVAPWHRISPDHICQKTESKEAQLAR
jgi:hypothetical protein